MMKILLNYYFIYIILILITYVLGKLINHILGKIYNDIIYQNIFLNFYSGTLLIVCVFAIYQTNFKTVFVLVPILILIWLGFFEKKKQFNYNFRVTISSNQEIYKVILLVLPIFSFFYFLQYYILIGGFTESMPQYIPNIDYISYARISEYLILTGRENIWQVNNLILEDYHGTIPYHYFNEWITAFLIKITNQKSIFLQELVLNSFLLSLIVLGFLSFIEYFKSNVKILDILVCILSVFLKSIITIQVLYGIELFSNNSFSMPKISILYIMLIPPFLFFLQKKYIKANFFLLLIPIAYFTATPAILISTVIIIGLNGLNQEKKRETLKNLLLPFLIFVLIISFYQYTRNTSPNYYEFINYTQYIKTGINIIGGVFLQITILSLPFILFLVLLMYVKKINFTKFTSDLISTLLPSFIIIASAGISWALFNPIIDSVQLFQNIGVVTLNTLFTICFLYMISIRNMKKLGYLIVFIVLSVCLYQTNLRKYSKQFYSEEYLISIQYAIEKYKLNPIGASLFGVEDYKLENTGFYINHKFSVNTNVAVLGANLKYIANNFNTICLSVHDIPNKNDNFVRNMIDISCFNKYFIKTKCSNVIEARKRFINEYKINYVIASKYADISYLKDNIKTVIIDKYTQEKFIILKH